MAPRPSLRREGGGGGGGGKGRRDDWHFRLT